jgi:hypothetical protein
MANRALLVGINAYPGAELQGCLNDVIDVRDYLLRVCGFAKGDVYMLLDEAATTEGIKSALQSWLLFGAGSGDRLVFHYSGHGTTMAVGNGDDDTLHATLCPVDFDFTRERAILDVDLRDVFEHLPAGVAFNWVSDSCFSGDLARAVRGRLLANRTYPMSPEMAARIDVAKARGIEVFGFRALAKHLNGAFVSGCGPTQTSADAYIEGRYNGAATYALLRELKMAGQVPLTQVVEGMNRWLDDNDYEQNPELKGDPAACERPWLTL